MPSATLQSSCSVEVEDDIGVSSTTVNQGPERKPIKFDERMYQANEDFEIISEEGLIVLDANETARAKLIRSNKFHAL